MPLFRHVVFGSSNIGAYIAMNNNYLIYPPQVSKTIIESAMKINPDLIPIETAINDSFNVGSYIAMNSNGIIIPSLIQDHELEKLKKNMAKDFMITVVDFEENAFGNLILCNDHGAIISQKLEDIEELISEALNVPVKVLKFADTELAGSAGIANNSGVIVHPMISEDEAEEIANFLKGEIDVSTINCGRPFVKGGIVVNDKGAIFGRDTTGPEIQRIAEILNIMD